MLSNDKNDKTEFSVMIDMLIALIMLSLISVYYYGLRAAAVLAVTVIACLLTDYVCIKLRKKDTVPGDISALITGLTLGLMMSASVPYYAAVTAAVFGIAAAKQAFGGHGCEIFNPAAAGWLFAALCFPDGMLTYPKTFSDIPMSSVVPESLLGQSFTKAFIATEASSLSSLDVLVGKFSSPMGTGYFALIAAAAAFLLFRRDVSPIMFLSEALTAGIIAFVHYKFEPMSMLYFFSSGMLLFGMLFLSCDSGTLPKTKSSRLIYGVFVGLCIALFHFVSHTENAVVYAVIISAPVCTELNRRSVSFAEMLKNKKGIFRKTNKSLKHVEETLEMLDKKEGDK